MFLTEGFDDVSALPGSGWAVSNNSVPLGLTDWFQGNADLFGSQSGAPDSYLGANYNNTTGAGTISNWLLTPVLTLDNGAAISFYTCTPIGSIDPDRLELRLSAFGASTDVGSTATSVGDFALLLTTINPNLEIGGYPDAWTRFDSSISGLGGPVSGRLALRYFVTDGGPYGYNSNYIGIDTFSFASAPPPPVPEPSTCLLVGLGTLGLAAWRIRRRR
jgi:hypothetical protein